jgi:hypothetical protein
MTDPDAVMALCQLVVDGPSQVTIDELFELIERGWYDPKLLQGVTYDGIRAVCIFVCEPVS